MILTILCFTTAAYSGSEKIISRNSILKTVKAYSGLESIEFIDDCTLRATEISSSNKFVYEINFRGVKEIRYNNFFDTVLIEGGSGFLYSTGYWLNTMGDDGKVHAISEYYPREEESIINLPVSNKASLYTEVIEELHSLRRACSPETRHLYRFE